MFFFVFATLKIPRLTVVKTVLAGRFAILMPAKAPLLIAKPFICLAATRSLGRALENPKYWEQSINHNRGSQRSVFRRLSAIAPHPIAFRRFCGY